MKEHTEGYYPREIHTLPITKTYSLHKVQFLYFVVLSVLVTSKTPQKLGIGIIHNNLKANLTGPSSFLEQKIQTKLVLRHTSNHSAEGDTVGGWYALDEAFYFIEFILSQVYTIKEKNKPLNSLHMNSLMTKVTDKLALISYWFYFFLLILLFGSNKSTKDLYMWSDVFCGELSNSID